MNGYAKVAIGIKQWHPEYCVGQYRMDDCHADCQLPDMDIAAAKAAGAKTLVIGGRCSSYVLVHDL